MAIKRPATWPARLSVGKLASRDYNELAVWRQFERYDLATDVFPHGANMCWRRDLWPADYLPIFTAANPDYLGGARLLACSKLLRHVDFPVTIIPRDSGVENSVGAAWQLGDKTPAVLEYAADICRPACAEPCVRVLHEDLARWGLWPNCIKLDQDKAYWRWVIDRVIARRVLSPEQIEFLKELRQLLLPFKILLGMLVNYLKRD